MLLGTVQHRRTFACAAMQHPGLAGKSAVWTLCLGLPISANALPHQPTGLGDGLPSRTVGHSTAQLQARVLHCRCGGGWRQPGAPRGGLRTTIPQGLRAVKAARTHACSPPAHLGVPRSHRGLRHRPGQQGCVGDWLTKRATGYYGGSHPPSLRSAASSSMCSSLVAVMQRSEQCCKPSLLWRAGSWCCSVPPAAMLAAQLCGPVQLGDAGVNLVCSAQCSHEYKKGVAATSQAGQAREPGSPAGKPRGWRRCRHTPGV